MHDNNSASAVRSAGTFCNWDSHKTQMRNTKTITSDLDAFQLVPKRLIDALRHCSRGVLKRASKT
eukprot:3105311-Amphidinium_carterae.1